MPGLSGPRIALGCGNFGGVGSAPEFFGRGLTEDQAFELMDAAWESGLAWFDTADAYGGGRGALAPAAALTGRAGTGKVVCVVSGGNINLGQLCEILAGAAG